MCVAKCSSSSVRWPVRMLTTPLGTSLVASTSEKVTAGRGLLVEARATAVLPPARVGAMTEIKPSKGESSGARIETTPVGSRMEKLKWLEETGFTLEKTCWYLSAQPA